MSRRSQQLIRTWRVIALLRSCCGVSLERLARETGVTGRTIRRDLEALAEAGLPLFDDKTENGVTIWRFVKGTPCALCGRGMATGREWREQQRTTSPDDRVGGLCGSPPRRSAHSRAASRH